MNRKAYFRQLENIYSGLRVNRPLIMPPYSVYISVDTATMTTYDSVGEIFSESQSGGTGIGDMLKSVYDPSNTGSVVSAQTLLGYTVAQLDQSAHLTLTNNPHLVTKAQIGLSNVDNSSDISKPLSSAALAANDAQNAIIAGNTAKRTYPVADETKLAGIEPGATGDQDISGIATNAAAIVVLDATKLGAVELTNHTSNVSNPHSVTKAQVGLSNVDNTSDTSKPISTAAANYNATQDGRLNNLEGGKADVIDLIAHAALVDNPHQVTASQVGLGNVDNTSDINKPMSSAANTANSIQDVAIALNTAKRSYPLAHENRLINTSGSNTGDQNAAGVGFTPTGNTASDNVQAAIVELQSEIDALGLSNVAAGTTLGSILEWDGFFWVENTTAGFDVSGNFGTSNNIVATGTVTSSNVTNTNAADIQDNADNILINVGGIVANASDILDRLKSVTVGEPAGSDIMINAVTLTQAEYDAGPISSTTLYVIKG